MIKEENFHIQEYRAFLNAADGIIRAQLAARKLAGQTPSLTTGVLIKKILAIPGLKAQYPGFKEYRFRQILSTAANRGYFTGLLYLQSCGFRYPKANEEFSAAKLIKARKLNVKNAIALLTSKGWLLLKDSKYKMKKIA